jgi:hypothetical protein
MTTRRRTPTAELPGAKSLFRRKVRQPVSITLTRRHHAKVRKAMKRLGVSRSDLIALLIEQHADTVKRED